MKKILLIPIITFAVLLSSCNKEKPAEQSTESKKGEGVTLPDESLNYTKVDTVEMIPDSDEFTVVGEVSFDEDNVVRVFPIVSGSVEGVNVSLGDYVQKGQLLATILSTDISTYQGDYNIAKSNFEVADKNLKRAKELFATNVISERDLAQAQNDFNNAQSEFKKRKQILELYGGSSQNLDALYKVYAPNSGYIVERNINQGMQIRTDNASTMFTISDLKTVWVWANVYESDLSKIHEGDEVQVRTIAYPDKIFTGQIKKIGTMLDPASRVIKVRTELDNREGLLKPEMFATVIISPKKTNEVLAIPTSALVIENNAFWVMKEIKENTFTKVKIKPGKTIRNYTEIHEGLAAGDKIVTEGALFLTTSYNNQL
ncbi:efflux RND transporter periplasmic adaptor subunit [Rhodocytophaga rosea]|uniref:Efflux RND transporter periplasmic adaptor subunit n=1 Tax=Rhodocytophaga rosea TaxID=2704465 RepID=A0A6C0GG46_9BACT|nr:efflux RND transporter periplasmic adaptor subunit [Rhodocytophaga rosea]QHT66879.1 efflux RND transporter periplasmic adaptor subunit [Rhodocytophaga rosea]